MGACTFLVHSKLAKEFIDFGTTKISYEFGLLNRKSEDEF